jgi:hypothetical protein
VVALERKDAPGVWIPNRPKDDWDPAHPAEHTRLFISGGRDLVRVRARAIRLAKGWNAQFAKPGLSSFNIEAIAWECVAESMSEAEALAEFFGYGAKQLAGPETDDPAGVSGPIRLLLDKDQVVNRLERASELMHAALDQEDDEPRAKDALAELFWEFVTPTTGNRSKASFADALRKGKSFSVGPTGLTVGASEGSKVLKSTRSYGDAPEP